MNRVASIVAVACWVAIVFGPPWAKLAAFTIGVPAGIGATAGHAAR